MHGHDPPNHIHTYTMVTQYQEPDSSSDSDAADRRGYGSISPESNIVVERKPLVIDAGTEHNDETCNGKTALSSPPPPAADVLHESDLLRDEICGMTKLAVPVIITYILEMFPGIVTIMLVGRMCVDYDDHNDGYGDGDTNLYDNVEGGYGGEDGGEGAVGSISLQKLHLDAASLAVMFTNVVALSPAYGKCEKNDIVVIFM